MESEQSSSPPSPSTPPEVARRIQVCLRLLGEERMRSSAKQLHATLGTLLSEPSWPLKGTVIESAKTEAQQFVEAISTFSWNINSPYPNKEDYDVVCALSL